MPRHCRPPRHIMDRFAPALHGTDAGTSSRAAPSRSCASLHLKGDGSPEGRAGIEPAAYPGTPRKSPLLFPELTAPYKGPCREGSSPHDHLLAQAQRRMTQALLSTQEAAPWTRPLPALAQEAGISTSGGLLLPLPCRSPPTLFDSTPTPLLPGCDTTGRLLRSRPLGNRTGLSICFRTPLADVLQSTGCYFLRRKGTA